MKTFYCRIGNKSLSAKQIIKYFPDHDVYTEPFIGAGAVFFLKDKDKSKYEIINDLDTELINSYKFLKNIKINFNIIKDIKRLSQYDTIQKKRMYLSDNTKNKNIDKLYKILLNSCNTFSNTGKGKIYKNTNQFTKLKKINEYKERLNNVIIQNTDYKKILIKYDSPKTLHYLDPPYENSKTLYKDSYMDYKELETNVRKLKGYVLISLNDSPNIRNIFKDYNIVKIEEIGSKRIANKFTKRTDILIMNFK